MSVIARSPDAITEDFLVLGLPVVDFAFELASGGYGAYFGLGIPESTEVQKALQVAQLRNAQSGTSKLVRELVRQFDATIQVGTFRHSGANMQLMFASATLLDVASSVVVVTDDPFRLTTDDQDFHDLSNQRIVETLTLLECDDIVDEVVGVGDGTLGASDGEYKLDFKPLGHDDVTSLTVGGVAWSIIAVGAEVAGNEVTVKDYGDSPADAGDLQFFTDAVGVDVTGEILATYRPEHLFVENTDFVVDYVSGRIRILSHDQAADPCKDNQPMRADYSYNRATYEELEPYTQFIFPGRARVRQLTDVGMNIVWTIPKAQARLNEDAFVFNRDDFTVTNILLQLLEDQTDPTQPYGNLRLYREGTF